MTHARSLDSGDAPVLEVIAPAAKIETDCLDGAAQTPQDSGAPRWLQNFDGPEISGVSADARGNLWLTQSGAQTRLLSPEGEQLWSRPFGARVALSSDGRAYVAGTFSGSQLLGDFELSSSGARDAYLVELSSAGDVLSAFALGGAEDDDVESLNVDARGNVVVSGLGLGVQKLSADGSLLWQSSFAGPSAVAPNGSVWLTGNEADDVQLIELSEQGELLSRRRFGDAGSAQRGEAIALDAAGNVAVAGTFAGSIDFGTGALSKPSTACSSDAWCETFGFVALFDANGNARFASSLGPLRAVGGTSFDLEGDVVVSAALPGGVRPFRQTWLGAFDVSGNALWHRSEWPGTGIGAGHALGADACGRLIWGLSARPSLELEEQSFVTLIQP